MASQLVMNVSGFSSGTEYTNPIRLAKSDARSVAVHFNWSAVLTATPVCLVSNDPAIHGIIKAGGPQAAGLLTANWIDYSSEVPMVSPPAGGSERNGGINASFFGYEWARFGLVWGAGTPDVLAWASVIK